MGETERTNSELRSRAERNLSSLISWQEPIVQKAMAELAEEGSMSRSSTMR